MRKCDRVTVEAQFLTVRVTVEAQFLTVRVTVEAQFLTVTIRLKELHMPAGSVAGIYNNLTECE